MKNFKVILCVCLVLTCFAFETSAGVTFLPNASGSVGKKKSSSSKTPEQMCRSSGYKYTTCGVAQKAINECPYKKGYFKTCCPKNYLFTKEECINQGLSYSSDKCGIYRRCI